MLFLVVNMEQLTHFQPVFLTIAGIVFVVGVVIAIQKYIRSQVQPTERKVNSIEKSLTELKTESRIEQVRNQDNWHDVKTTLNDVGNKLHEITVSQAEVKVALFGHDGSNGIRGELRALRQDVKELTGRVGTLERE